MGENNRGEGSFGKLDLEGRQRLFVCMCACTSMCAHLSVTGSVRHPRPAACCIRGLVGHALSPPISASYHLCSAQLLQAPVTQRPAVKTPQTALGLCTLATPGFPKGIEINIELKRDLFCWITWNSLALNLSVIHHIQWNHVKVGA